MGETQIKEWQKILKIEEDGDFGNETLKASKEVAIKAGILLPEPKPETNNTPWIDIAKAELGVKEKKGGENPRILEYLKATTIGAPADTEDETPWCSAFVTWCLKKSGYKSTNSAWARSYENYGIDLPSPKFGCIVVFDWNNGSGHVGFVSSFTNSTVTVLGGNQSDSVNYTVFSRKNVSAWIWPVK